MSVQENKVIARTYVEEMHNNRNYGVAESMCRDDCVVHLGLSSLSREDYSDIVQGYDHSFSDLKVTVEDQVGEDDKVATRWETRFTHTRKFMGVEPSGKEITVTGTSIYRFSEGRIAEIWINWDRMTVMQQIGTVSLS